MYQGVRRDATVTLLNLLALGLIVWRLRDPRATAVRIEPPPTPIAIGSPTPTLAQVYVSGAVARPGLVKLAGDARLADAVSAAGGLTAEAATAAVNLAAPVQDGEHVHVPTVAELSAAGGALAAPAAVSPVPGHGLSDSTGLASPRVPPSAALGGLGRTASDKWGETSSASDSRIRVNQATAAELERLPGIGPALAGRIVAYREAHGPFQSVNDLLAVSGIGEKTLARFADQIVVP